VAYFIGTELQDFQNEPDTSGVWQFENCHDADLANPVIL